MADKGDNGSVYYHFKWTLARMKQRSGWNVDVEQPLKWNSGINILFNCQIKEDFYLKWIFFVLCGLRTEMEEKN